MRARALQLGGEFDVVHTFDFTDGFLTNERTIKVAEAKFIPGALAADGEMLYVPGVFGHAVAVIGPAKNDRVMLPLGKNSYPFACLVDPAHWTPTPFSNLSEAPRL